MGLLNRLFGNPKRSSLSATDWILRNTNATLEVTVAGPLPTPEGKACIIDPLVFAQGPVWVNIPKEGGEVTVFHDTQHGRNSKLALIFPGGPVAGGADVATCGVDAGMASIFTPATHDAMATILNSKPDMTASDAYFLDFDDPLGGERMIVPLPDGTPIPYIHSGWGDGGYPVFTLTDASGQVVALYTDFMGKDKNGTWLTPPKG